MKIRINDEIVTEKLRLQIRLDYKAEERSGRFLFGSKTNQAMAETVREQQINLLKNIPLQGIDLQDFDSSMEVYVITEEKNRRTREVAYAPLILTLKADNIQDVIPFLLRPEFKKIEILGPESINISKQEMERLMFSIFKLFSDKIDSYN
ncbi:MAG: hypothetical protein APF84_18310 [Gracilibacter sp. BRH_c7a]|nr:MAG: hypothetical protein APF84_18310 [Gracilibacter sp. BRH_c7a]